LIYQTPLFIYTIKNVGLMNQAPTEDELNDCININTSFASLTPLIALDKAQFIL